MRIDDPIQLRELYGLPAERARNKVLNVLDVHCTNFIEKSPFLVLSSCDQNGRMDASPRGGAPGFVRVLNQNKIVIPDSKGNNRIDSLINILEFQRAGALFLIPGVDETLRLNGAAYISNDTELLDMFSNEKRPPKTCIVISVEEAFMHCAKALMRSKLWMNESKLDRSEFPTMGQILKDQLNAKEMPESQEDMIERYKGDL